MKDLYYRVATILVFVFASGSLELQAQCGTLTPSYTVNLIGSPNGTYTSPSITRQDTCCGGVIAGECLKFTIFLDPKSMGINFGFASGAEPPGALYYQINCGNTHSVGTPICLSGSVNPHILTFCKPGGNSNTFSISSIPKPIVPDSIFVRNGCTQTLAVSGFSVPTINWTSVPSNTLYNSYLNCLSGCASVAVTPDSQAPSSVLYKVSGYAASPCQADFYEDTVRVYFYTNLSASITPFNPTICFGTSTVALTTTVTGGKLPYTYTWSTGSNNQSIVVGPGTYTVLVKDGTGCPGTTVSSTVSQFTLPITVNAGPNRTVCKTSPNVILNSTLTSAPGVTWTSSGSGTFVPSSSATNATFVPSGTTINSGSVQIFVTTTGNAGCAPGYDTVNVFFQEPPVITPVGNQTVCANNNLTPLSATVSGFPATVTWSTAGTGTFSSVSGSSTTYSPGTNDINTGSVTIVATTTNNGFCPAASGSVVVFIMPKPVVNAGPDFTICSNSNVALSGSVTVTSSTGFWTSSGDGGFGNQSSLITTYTPGTNDISAGTVTLTLTSTNNNYNCLPVQDAMVLTIRRLPVVTVSTLAPVCSITATVPLTGTVTGATSTGSWSSSGSGFIANFSSTNTSYALSNADRTTTAIQFTLTSTNNGVCPAVSNTITLPIVPMSTVYAGSNFNYCSNQNTIALAAGQPTITGNTTTGVWTTTGTGTFANSTNINTTYTMSTGDINTGMVTFTLTSTNNSVCPAGTDTVRIRISKLASITIPTLAPICSITNSVAITGSITGATSTGSWSTSGSGFIANNTFTTTSYTLGNSDRSITAVQFTLTSTNNGVCPAVSNTVVLPIVPMASVNAGSNFNYCSAQNTISLAAGLPTITGQTTGIWTSSGTGTFANSTNINTTYSISTTDINNGTVTFTLTSTNNSVCPAASDTVRIRITKLPQVFAGSNTTVCSNASSVALTGTVNSATGTGVWASGGTGGFTPGPNSLNTSYAIQPTDITNGLVVFTLSSTGNTPCPTVANSVTVFVSSFAIVTATSIPLICSAQKTIALNGNIISATSSGSWSANGTGTFVPSANLVNTTYSMSAGDISAGNVKFTLSSTNNGICPMQQATISVAITKQPVTLAGASKSICATSTLVALTGTVNSVSGSGSWGSAGNGTFTPSNTQLNTNYIISPTDISNGSVLLNLSSVNNSPCQEAVDTVRIYIKSPAIVSTSPAGPMCSSTKTVQLNGGVNGGSQSGTWTSSGTGTFVPSASNLAATYSISQSDILAGTITLSLTSTNNGVCAPVVSSVPLVIKQQPTVNAGPDKTICSNSLAVNLSATVTGVTNTGIWNTDGAGTLSNNTSLTPGYSFTPADVTKGKVRFFISSTNNDLCPSSYDTLAINIIKFPVLILKSDTTICEKNNRIWLSPGITGGSGQLKWTSTGTGSFIPNNYSAPTNYQISAQDSKAGNVVLSVSSIENGPCGNVSTSLKVKINPSPTAGFAASTYTVILPADAVIFTNQSAGATIHRWDFGDGTGSSAVSPSKKYREVGYYNVRLIVKNELQCADTTERLITVISSIKLPTAFTPNGDKLNDTFHPYTAGVVEYDLMIFNRWGELIFRSTDINVGWDGTFNGKPCQQDAYVWKADMKFFDGRTFSDTGSITLIR